MAFHRWLSFSGREPPLQGRVGVVGIPTGEYDQSLAVQHQDIHAPDEILVVVHSYPALVHISREGVGSVQH